MTERTARPTEERQTPARASDRKLPRISSARGGLAPGIEDLRDGQELEDLEYIERLKGGFGGTAGRSRPRPRT